MVACYAIDGESDNDILELDACMSNFSGSPSLFFVIHIYVVLHRWLNKLIDCSNALWQAK